MKTKGGSLIDIISTTQEILPESWNLLVGPNGFYSSYEWIQSLEIAHGENPIFIVRNNKEVMGVIPTWKGPSSSDKLFSLAKWAGDLPGNWGEHFLWLGGHRVTANSLICIRGRQREKVMNKLIQSFRNYAAKQSLSGAIWPFLSLNEANELAKYCPDARVVLHSADPILHVSPNGFQDLIKYARRHDRKKWLKEIKDFQNKGATVLWKPLEVETIPLLARLISENRSKYGSSGGSEWMTRTLSAQVKSGVAKKAVTAISSIENQIKAIAVFYRHHDWLYGRYWGAENDAPPYAYYNLTHYAAIDWAAENGFRHIHLSISAWESKVRRGAKLYPMAMVIFPPQGELSWVTESAAFEHNMSAMEDWKKRFSSRLEAFDFSWNHIQIPMTD